MSEVTAHPGVTAPVTIPSIPVAAALPWLVLSTLLFAVAMYFLGAEEGATSLVPGTVVHEWVHDGRHLLGFPATEGPVLTTRSFLVRGLLAGLIAGIVSFGIAYVVGEPSLNAGIATEEMGSDHAHADGAADHDEASEAVVVPRSLQSTAGLATGTVVAGVTLGGLFGVLSALALGRFGRLGPRATTLGVTAAGFVALSVIPSLGYPPNPPGVGSGDSIGPRTALYFLLVAISVLAAVVGVLVGRRLAARWGGWYATLAGVLCYLLLTVSAIAVLPSYDEVPAGFPATVLFEFRRASLIVQLSLWAVLGVVLADLAERLTRRAQPRSTHGPQPVIAGRS